MANACRKNEEKKDEEYENRNINAGKCCSDFCSF